MSESEYPATEPGPHGATSLTLEELDGGYQFVGGDLKAKLWRDGGRACLFLRVRDSDDGRTFNEFVVEIPGGGD